MPAERGPLTYSEVSYYVRKCKKSSRSDVECIQRFLQQAALDVGYESHEVIEAISSLTERFVEEERQMRREEIAKELRRNKVLGQESIDADDDQIVQAVKWALPQFKSDRDWAGVYRILVDCCEFPAKKTDFVRRFARMGIYPTDSTVKEIERTQSPAIHDEEWQGHRFSYQAIQKGIGIGWPQTYAGWKTYDTPNRDFAERLAIANTFLTLLKKAVATG